MDAGIATPRARAMWGYSQLSQPALAEKAGLNYHRLRAILADGSGDVALEELQKIADAAGVPYAFIEQGFDAIAEADDLAARVSRLESDLEIQKAAALEAAAAVQQRFDGMSQTMARLLARQQP